jgi:hypothetical protein
MLLLILSKTLYPSLITGVFWATPSSTHMQSGGGMVFGLLHPIVTKLWSLH